MNYRTRDKLSSLAFLLPALLLLVVFRYGSLVFTSVISFFDFNMLSESRFIGFANYLRAAEYDRFWWSLAHVARYAVEYIAGGLILGLILALLLEAKARFLVLFQTLYFLPLVLSVAVVAWVFRLLLAEMQIGILNDPRWAMEGVVLMSLWHNLGYFILIYIAGLSSVDPVLYEVAQIDGANYLRRAWHITVPLLRPVILFLSITGLIGAFQLFGIILVLSPYGESAGGPEGALEVPLLLIYRQTFEYQKMGYGAALSLVLFVIILLITLIQGKFGRLARGVT